MAQWIVRMGESWLKSKPVRRHFTQVIRNTLKAQCLVRGASASVRIDGGLMFVEGEDAENIEDALRHTFGVYAIDPYANIEPDPKEVAKAALNSIDELDEGTSFAVRCKRHGQKGEWTSQTFAGATGAAILDLAPHLTVNLSEPQWEIRIALFPENARLLDERIMGPGGLPSGVQGLIHAHLDCELDILSAWLMMRRGCRIEALSGEVDDLVQWDPILTNHPEVQSLVTGPGKNRVAEPWGIVGSRIENAPTTVGENEEVRTPLVNLEPLVGWSEKNIESLRTTVFN